MSTGFLGYDTTLMLDMVATALFFIAPLLIYSVVAVRYRRQFARHRKLQITLGALLLATVSAFEIDVQLVHGGWENIVGDRRTPDELEVIRRVLWVHLLFAVSTPVLWVTTLVAAIRGFGSPPHPGAHSKTHRILGWIAAVDLLLTSVTGMLFYYMAFVR